MNVMGPAPYLTGRDRPTEAGSALKYPTTRRLLRASSESGASPHTHSHSALPLPPPQMWEFSCIICCPLLVY